jgi:hypothetical protein
VGVGCDTHADPSRLGTLALAGDADAPFGRRRTPLGRLRDARPQELVNGRRSRNMARRYRSSHVWVWFLLWLPLGTLICLTFVVAGTSLLARTLMGDTDDTPLGFAAAFWTLGSLGGAAWIIGALGLAYELTLTDDGTVEFRSLLRRKHIPGSWIISVVDADGTLVVRHRTGRLRLLEPDDFDDFLARLKRLSPDLNVEGPERWRNAADGI